MTTFTPTSPAEVLDTVQWAVSEETPVEIVGHGSKREIGRPAQTEHSIDLSMLSDVTLYEPEELVLSARAGTPVSEIEALLAEHGQELAFEPMDYGPLLGGGTGNGTIGGILAANLSGPRRIKAGAARDHILGVHAVSGRGEAFKSGGRVVKNVTGYDLSKGLAGSWGTLAVVTDVTFKVLPAAETETTLVLRGLTAGDYTLTIRHLGYGTREILVTVSPGDRLERNVELTGEVTPGDEDFVVRYQREQAQTLNTQKASASIRSIISSGQIDRFTDVTAEDAMARLPGVQFNRRGEVNLRGGGRDMHYVTVNGQRIGSTGLGERSVDLESISSDMVRELEVVKVITPDMDADAVSGVINISTRRPVGNGRELSARIGGGFNPRYYSQLGPNASGFLGYVDSPRDDLSYAVYLGHHLEQRPWESLEIYYFVCDVRSGAGARLERL
jgi:hypothetical protein